MRDEDGLPDNVFRANVGAVISNGAGLVLALERADFRGSWQLPQGGLEKNETVRDAVYREVFEETALEAASLRLLGEHPEWLAYELPPEKRTGKHGRGQVQKWFLFRLDASSPRLSEAKAGEFVSWKWMRFPELIERTADFRRPTYEKLVAAWGSEFEAPSRP